jgi:hypothetical protein
VRPAAAGVVVALLAAACGEASLPAPLVAGDVRGTPFLRPAPVAPAAQLAVEPTIGDLDTPRQGELPALPIAGPAEAARDATAASGAASGAADHRIAAPWDDLAGFEISQYVSESRTGETHEIPKRILDLSGRRVVAEGYMAPLVYEGGGAKRFLLMKDPMACCFAVVPRLNEWIEVTMQSGAVAEYVPHVLVAVEGVLDVKEEVRDGMSVGLYKLAATRAEFVDAK